MIVDINTSYVWGLKKVCNAKIAMLRSGINLKFEQISLCRTKILAYINISVLVL